jgi:hypothetical protein
MNLPRLIGITGRAGAGKDTVADYLVNMLGYTKYPLSAPMKKILNDRFCWTDANWADREWKEAPLRAAGSLDVDFGVNCFSPRSWAQWLGTEVGRAIGGEDVWVNMVKRAWANDGHGFAVVPDIRYDNEARALKSQGAVILRVLRPDVGNVLAHSSEKGISDYLVDANVPNTLTVNSLIDRSLLALRVVHESR